jgi:hypothetical protein
VRWTATSSPGPGVWSSAGGVPAGRDGASAAGPKLTRQLSQ